MNDLNRDVAEDRGKDGRLRVAYYVELIKSDMNRGHQFTSAAFKHSVEALGVLRPVDRDPEGNGYSKWKHRIDRARQRVVTGV